MDESDYLDFLIAIEGVKGALTRVISPVGEATAPFRLPFDTDELREIPLLLSEVTDGVRAVGRLRSVGGRLFEAIFTGELKEIFERSQDTALKQGRGLRLILELSEENQELFGLPWEGLYDREADRFLTMEIPLIRYFAGQTSTTAMPPQPPLRVLVAAPARDDELPGVNQEIEVLSSISQKSDGLLDLYALRGAEATFSRFSKAVESHRPHVLHFAGHGVLNEPGGEGALIFASESGESHPINGTELARALASYLPDLTVLIASASAHHRLLPPSEYNSGDQPGGVGQALVLHGLPTVVGMQSQISDRSAATFSSTFYEWILGGYPMEAAVTEARRAISRADDQLWWASPVVYTRVRNGHVFNFAVPREDLSSDLPVGAEPEVITPVEARTFTAQPLPKVVRDYWTVDDNLGYGAYARAVARFIQHEDSRPPLTIGIKGPWGAGKSSLMRMIQERLDPPKNRTAAEWDFADLQLTRDAEKQLGLATEGTGSKRVSLIARLLHRGRAHDGVTVAEAVSRSSQAEVAPPELADREGVKRDELTPAAAYAGPEPPPPSDWRPTVWFNPWMYQTGEEVWAGLAHEIITQITDRLPRRQKERFWLELNLRRLDRHALRRRIYRIAFDRLLLPALTVLAGVLLAAGTWALDRVIGDSVSLDAASGTVGSAGTVIGVLWAGVRWVRTFSSDAAKVIPSVVGGPLAAAKEGVQGDLGTTSEILPDPEYESRAGFLYLLHNDIDRVLDLVATPKRPLVVFVDDLDRCSPGVVAQTLEAINLFLAGEFPNCIFVLAVEPAVVAAHVEAAHEKLVSHLRVSDLGGDWSALGWRFLEKIVQLPLSLPRPERGRAELYLNSLFSAQRSAEAQPSAPFSSDRGSGALLGEETPPSRPPVGETTLEPQTSTEEQLASAESEFDSGSRAPERLQERLGKIDAGVDSLLQRHLADVRRLDGVAVARERLAEALELVGDPAFSAGFADELVRDTLRRVFVDADLSLDMAERFLRAPLDESIPALDEFKASATSLSDLPSAQLALESRLTAIGLDEPTAAAAVAAAGVIVLPSIYSDTDYAVREVIKKQALELPGRNPREIKRLVNLFRFYTLVANERRKLSGSSAAELGETFGKVARLSHLAIHWPFFLSLLARPDEAGRASDEDQTEDPPIVLERLEQDADTNQWLASLEKVGLAVRVEPGMDLEELQPWKRALDDLQEFLQGEPKIGSFARGLI